jgi:hypothetical protein
LLIAEVTTAEVAMIEVPTAEAKTALVTTGHATEAEAPPPFPGAKPRHCCDFVPCFLRGRQAQRLLHRGVARLRRYVRYPGLQLPAELLQHSAMARE